MNRSNQRELFASFLIRLTLGEMNLEEWQDLVVNHYFDEELEEIRRQLVRLSIQSPEACDWPEKEKTQLQMWVTQLLSKTEYPG